MKKILVYSKIRGIHTIPIILMAAPWEALDTDDGFMMVRGQKKTGPLVTLSGT